ncbi:Histidinol-phosphate aminotransferase 2, chloroplastic [Galdieria sulphuraria]|uniref:histidinol-phosphate transaminase n=1 Tax=Galdieria sulphuraria TaxID=130081 RepID=M2XKG4_GALSU|nr:histidinol-phosphate aminotransferase [Galdieria sulphuraria]EME30627.1 histidinol-phosphate aminotransferase [Galdieria sulphuraria]GJD09024.1 Histidinol-phosphate aminotransferase 2, chloroplastic [Galdieria sulphuraria]|eukprot:XP_005707147.1 histidinol-phosphate aminotransferase [Galdieria sulphuraria]
MAWLDCRELSFLYSHQFIGYRGQSRQLKSTCRFVGCFETVIRRHKLSKSSYSLRMEEQNRIPDEPELPPFLDEEQAKRYGYVMPSDPEDDLEIRMNAKYKDPEESLPLHYSALGGIRRPARHPFGKAARYSSYDEVREEVLRMEPYVPIYPTEVIAEKIGKRVDDIVKLDANENPYGPAPSVFKVLSNASYLHLYPDPESRFLRKKIAEYVGVHEEQIITGAGADDLIDMIFRLFICPGVGDSIVIFPPTFGMYKFDADLYEAHVFYAWREDSTIQKLPIDRVKGLFEPETLGPFPKIAFIASPNNPDGSVVSDDDLKELLDLPMTVVLDEAYFEFSGKTHVDWLKDYDNLIILRTFSKWAGLAGLRLGYGIFPESIVSQVWKIKQPYNVNVAAQLAGIATLEEKDLMLQRVEKIKLERERFYQRISSYQSWLIPYPSEANFVLCQVKGGRNARDIYNKLMKRGILIRYYDTKALSNCIRISMGTPQQMDILYDALDTL